MAVGMLCSAFSYNVFRIMCHAKMSWCVLACHDVCSLLQNEVNLPFCLPDQIPVLQCHHNVPHHLKTELVRESCRNQEATNTISKIKTYPIMYFFTFVYFHTLVFSFKGLLHGLIHCVCPIISFIVLKPN